MNKRPRKQATPAEVERRLRAAAERRRARREYNERRYGRR